MARWVASGHLQRPAHIEPVAGFVSVSHASRVERFCVASAPLAGGIGSTNPETHPGPMRLCHVCPGLPRLSVFSKTSSRTDEILSCSARLCPGLMRLCLGWAYLLRMTIHLCCSVHPSYLPLASFAGNPLLPPKPTPWPTVVASMLAWLALVISVISGM